MWPDEVECIAHLSQVALFGSLASSIADATGPAAFRAGVCGPVLGSLNVYHQPWRPPCGTVMPVLPSSKSEIVSAAAGQPAGRVLAVMPPVPPFVPAVPLPPTPPFLPP